MGYPRGLLSPDEEIIVDSHPHWKALIGSAIVTLVSLAVFFAVLIASDSMEGAGRTWLVGAVGVLALAATIWKGAIPFVRWFTTHFVITDRRVIFRTGVLTKQGIDIPLKRINTVQFRHGLIDRLFRTGTLIIESASDDPLSFDDIPDVEKVHALLYNELFSSLEGEEDGPKG